MEPPRTADLEGADGDPVDGVLTGKPAPPDDDPTEAEPEIPPADVDPVVVPRWIQVVGLATVLFGLFALARASGTVLLVFVVAAVIALILNPLVKLLQRTGLPRGIAIALVFVGFFGAVGGSIALLVNPVSNQIQAFQADLPRLVDSGNASLAKFQQTLNDRGIDIQFARRGETALETLRNNVIRGSGDVLSFTRDLVTVLLEAGFALVLVLVIVIYALLYGKQIGAVVRRLMPPGDGTPEDDFPIRVQKAVFSYVRGQLTFSLIMGTSAGVSLWVFGLLGIFPAGKTYAVFFGVFYGLMELIPYVGPVLGAAPPILVALFQGEPLTALWLAILFLVLQQLEGHVVAPQIFSHSLRMNPLVVIFVLLLGEHLHGIVGALLALPLAAIVRETYIYLRRHLVLEPWGTMSPRAIASAEQPSALPAALPAGVPAGLAALPSGTPRESVSDLVPAGPLAHTRSVRWRCPECAAASVPGAAFCWACGTSLTLGAHRSSTDGQVQPPGLRSPLHPAAWRAVTRRLPHRRRPTPGGGATAIPPTERANDRTSARGRLRRP